MSASAYGKLIISYNGGPTVDFGSITAISTTYQKSVTVVPLVPLPMDSTFAVESSSAMNHSFKFIRTNGTDGIDNADWYEELTSSLDRWQAKTNGFRLQFIPTNNPNIMPLDINVFYKACTRQYKQAECELIYGSIEFQEGTMHLLSSPEGDDYILKDDFEISVTNGTGASWYVLYSEALGVDCITSCNIYGGMEQPFEYMTMTVPKTRLTTVANGLVDHIVPGRSKVMVNAIGKSSMIVSSCELDSDNYKITAYCEAEVLRGYALQGTCSMTPFEWIADIVTSGKYGVSFTDGVTFLYSVIPPKGTEHIIEFQSGTNVWYIAQVCAVYMKAKLFFTDNKAYLVDYASPTASSSTNNAKFSRSRLELFPVGKSDDPMFAKVVGKASLGNEGKYPTLNSVTITCQTPDKDGNWVQTQETFVDQDSIDHYGTTMGAQFNVPELKQGGGYAQAERFAEGLFAYRRESVQSVEFTTREMYYPKDREPMWSPQFKTSLTVSAISSNTDDFEVDNVSEISGRPAPQKLMLSTFVRNYPKFTSKYKFGMVSSIDLSASTSQIRTALK